MNKGNKYTKYHADDNDVLVSMLASIKNDMYACGQNNRHKGALYKLKYMLWIITLVLISSRREIKTKKFIAVQTKLNETKLREYADNDEYFAYANVNKSFEQIKSKLNVFVPYRFCKRINICINGINFYRRNKEQLKGYLPYCIDYYAIFQYLVDNDINQIITAGMYERYCTLLSRYGEMRGIEVVGVQDGAAVDIAVPEKLYCDKMYVFDEFEQGIVKTFIKNEDCKWEYIGFKSTFDWSKLQSDKRIVAVASQDWFTEKTIALVDLLMQSIDNNKNQVVVFPHYRESMEQYSELCHKYSKLIVTEERYSNIDLLVTFYSTIVYDFWSVNKELPVVCLRIEGYEPAYYNRSNVEAFDSMNELVKNISL